MIRLTHRILVVLFVALVPLTAWLVTDHIESRDRLRNEAESRLRSWAEAAAAVIERTVGESQERHGAAVTVRLASDPDLGLVAMLSPGSGTGPGVRLDPRPPPTDVAPSAALLVTDRTGRVLARRPPGKPVPLTERARRKVSSLATREIAAGEGPGFDIYRSLDDRDVLGAWAPVLDLGGVIVEEPVAETLDAVRGARPWHFGVVLLVLTGLPLLLLVIARRWSAAASLLRLYAFVRPYWKLVVVVLLAAGVYAAGGGAQLYMIKLLVEDVLLGPDVDEAWRHLILLSVVMLVVVALMAGGRFVKAYVSARVTQGIVNDIRCALGRHLLTLSLGFFHRRRQGELLSRLTNDVGQSKQSLKLIFGDMLQEPLMLAGAIAAGFATNWQLALMIFFAFPAFIYPIARFGQKIKRYARKRQVQQADVTDVMVQMMSGVRIVKAFRMEEHEGRRLREANDRLLNKALKVARTSALSETVLEALNSFGAVIVMLAGGYFVLNNLCGVTVADLVTFSAILTRMYKPLKNLAKTYNKIQDSLPGIERTFEVLDLEPEITDRADARPLGRPDESIAFDGVTFAYDEEPVLTDISFEVPVGSVVALVGPTGAGKSTLTDLVARYYDPGAGRVLIDGVDLREVEVGSLLSRVAVVTQEPFLFHTTIRENILYGRPDATREEVEAAARAAFVHGEILEQPEGYDTVVGDRGAMLSGGQRQRITIARAILKDADILILDEATSSLDSRSEGEVQGALANLMTGRTTFVVAHRLSTIRNADLILVLERGRIVESGSHDELIAKGGLYATLHAMQEGGAAAESPGGADG